MPQTAEDPSVVPESSSFHILVVDDQTDVRQAICMLIEVDGYNVTGVGSGREALELLRDTSVDLVLTDLMMPQMNGWQLLRAIKENYSDLPVVVCTGFISEQGESILTDREVDGYLVKPISRGRMQVMLRALLYPQALGRPAEVVVVDDDKSVLEAVDHVLSQRGLYITSFQDVDKALRHIRKTPPDLAIIDLILPGVDGFDLCQAIRSDPDISQMPILILTAHPLRENVLRATELGVNGFVSKPYDPKALSEKVLQVLRQAGKR